MPELTSDDDKQTVNLASSTIIFGSCALLFGLKSQGVILCRFKATCSVVNTGLMPLVFGRSSDTITDASLRSPRMYV